MTNNVHASLIAIDGKGVLVMGPSGSGKTLLARHLFRRCRAAAIPVSFISDDQVLLEAIDGRLVGRAPDQIYKKMEVFGFGVVDINQCVESRCAVQLQVALGAAEDATRYWDGVYFNAEGISVQSLVLSVKQVEAAGNAVFSCLGYDIGV